MSLVNFLWAIPVFGLMVFIHELGHFAVAKFYDIRVQEFALGFGPAIVGFTKGETRYNWRLVPLGGFVRMAGMEESDQDDPRGFNRKPVLARALVIAAGPIMNFVLASLLFSAFLYFVGMEPSKSPVIGDVPTKCEAVVNGQNQSVTCPAFAAGLQAGDRVVAINGKSVTEWQDILTGVTQSEGKPVAFRVDRGGQTLDLTMQPIRSGNRYMVGILASMQRVPFGTALAQGPVITYKISGAWLRGIGDMIVGNMKPELMGPVRITQTIAEEASRGLDNLLYLTAFLSLNLGLLNLLPIPALDGSRLVFMVVEAIRGRRLDPARENMVHFVGFVVMIGLMLVITYGEVLKR